MKPFVERLLGIVPWKREWQEALSLSLQKAQDGLPVNMVVVVARESDLYAEVLFLLSFAGLALGVSLGSWMNLDPSLPALVGFAVGSTLFAFRRFFISRAAPRAIRDRVANRAKALFFDHEQHLKSRVFLVYLSELEREAIFLASPDLTEKVPSREVRAILSKLVQKYESKNPIVALEPALVALGGVLKAHFGTTDEPPSGRKRPLLYVVASDRPVLPQIPVLKGSKDIN